MKIIFLDSHTLSLDNDVDFSGLSKSGDYTGYDFNDNQCVVEKCLNAQIIITNKIIVDSGIISSLGKLKLICVIATGYNNVDILAAREKGIPVVNVPDYAKYSVSQHVFSLILNLATKTCQYHEDVRKGLWQKSKNFTFLKHSTFELAGKTLGIIGFGAIGRELAKIATGFEMNVLVNEISDISETGYKNYSLDHVLINSDIVTIHCPLNDITKNLVNKDKINLMKKNAILINTSRGGIINEHDLKEALENNTIAGAGIDVISAEPPRDGNPLLENVKNLIITPHSAWSTREARQRMIDITAENIEFFIKGVIKNQVN